MQSSYLPKEPSMANKLVEKSKVKLAAYTKLVKEGASKKLALVQVRKQFKSGIDPRSCTAVHKKLGLSTSEMKRRGAGPELLLSSARRQEVWR
jgi:hypothetical protein